MILFELSVKPLYTDTVKITIRTIYLYLFSAIGLIISVIAVINILDLTLRSLVFTKADESYYSYAPQRIEITPEGKEIVKDDPNNEELAKAQATSQKQREVSNSVAMLLVGVPLYLYHWKTIQKKKLV